MPVLINSKHERFAQLVASGANKTEAAKSLGYSPTRAASTGCNLAKNRNIAARIAELSHRASEQAICSVAVNRMWVLERLKTAVMLALRLEEDGTTPAPTFSLSAANQSLRLLGQEVGMFRESVDYTHQMVPPEQMTEAQLAQWMAYLSNRIAIAKRTDPMATAPSRTIDLPSPSKET
jgi:hypothetical protein